MYVPNLVLEAKEETWIGREGPGGDTGRTRIERFQN
jgi:hypothetical protein